MVSEDTKPVMADIKTEEMGSPTPKATTGSKVKAHYKKWWWVHLIILVVLVLVITLPLVYVGFPRIAQDNINKSTLTVTALTLSNPTSTGFHLFQNATIGNKSKYHPNLDAFNASLALDGGNPFAYVEFPKLHATKTATSIVDQDVQITDADAFAAYTEAVLGKDEIKVRVNGRTGLHEGSLPTSNVDYKKQATLKGLNSLNGFKVTDFSVKLTPDPDGSNMVGKVSIPNPTVMTLSMGNVSFNTFLPATASTPQTPIGVTTLNDLTLTPGENAVEMRAKVNQTLVIGAVSQTYKDGMLPIEIMGNSSVYNGQHLPYFEKALQGLTQKITLDVGAALKKAGVDPSALSALGGGGSS